MVLLAVSGGIDSMYMAATCHLAGLQFAVAHCNFHLRGADSDADEALVRDWCAKAGVQCHVKDFDTAAYAAENGVSIEMAARELRYAWFAQLCAGNGYEAVLIAHNANDNAETLLLNLVRGTGLKGICGMAEKSEMVAGGHRLTVLRPLLGVSRAQIAAFVAENNIPFREDRTNADVAYKRNRIRHQVLPELEAMNPSVLQTLALDMANFCEASAVADTYYGDFLTSVGVDDRAKVISVPLNALACDKHCKYLLFRLMEPYGFTRSDIDDVAALVVDPVSGKRFYAGTTVAYFTATKLVIAPSPEPWAPVQVAGPGKYVCGGKEVMVSVEPVPQNLVQNDGSVLLDADRLGFPFELRPWREGDWMCPLGLGGKKRKLSDIFVSLKVAALEKDAVVLVSYPGQEGRVAAIAGFGRIDDSLKATSATNTVIRIK